MTTDKRFDKLINSWKIAHVELGIDIISPYVMNTKGGKVEFPILVRRFGRKKGTLITTHAEFTDNDIPVDKDYYFSIVNEKEYSEYNKELFIETLEDWGYFGDENDKPDWFNGYVHNRS